MLPAGDNNRHILDPFRGDIMKSSFMGAFRHHARDQDNLDRYLRILGCFFMAMTRGSFWFVSLSLTESTHKALPLSVTLTSTLVVSVCSFLSHGWHKCDETCDETLTSPVRRPYLAPCSVALIMAGLKAAPPGWWNHPVVIERLQYAVLFLAAAWLLLRAGEKAVQLRRSGQQSFEGLG